MKKILSFALAAIMLLSMIVVSSSAAGTLIFSDDFDMGFKPANWIQGESCAFKWDSYSKCIEGYDDAVVLQSNFNARDAKMWDQFYSSFDFQIRDFDDLEPRDSHYVGMWYRDLFENDDYSGEQQGAAYTFWIEIETGKATFKKEHTFRYRDDNNILQDARVNITLGEAYIPGTIEIGENAPWYEIGMRVTEGKIECYFEQKLVFAFEADPNDEKLGHIALNSVDASVGSQRSPILFWNTGNWIGLDNFEIWSPDYDFASVTYGDVNGDSIINAYDAVLVIQKIARWDVTVNEAAADVNLDGIVSLADVVKIMQYVAKWDVVLGSAT